MNLRIRDWIPGIAALVLIAVDILSAFVPGLPSGVEVGALLVLAVIQALWIGVRVWRAEDAND